MLRVIRNHKRAAYNVSGNEYEGLSIVPVSYTHLRAHETVLDIVCRLLLEKKKHYIHRRL